MSKIINKILYTIIILLIATINTISIKKFFDNKKSSSFDAIIATNFVSTFVSFNEIEPLNVVESSSEEIIEIENIITEDESITKDTTFIYEDVVEDIVIQEDNNITSNILYDGLSEQDLILKLDKNLKNELSGTAINFVTAYKNLGLDPYLAVAIVLHETGCSWTCSNLVKECYNYGGLKGGEVKYKDTNYSCYSSKVDGINAYLNMLYNNYYSKGLITPELINPKYAASLEWSVKINSYIEKISNS